MNIALASPRRLGWERIQRFFWLYPDWWCAALSCLAWAMLLQGAWTHAGHAAHRMAQPLSLELAHWLLMVAAMMIPFLLPTLRAAAVSSLWSRRHRAMALVLTGYLAPWLALGAAAAAIRSLPVMHSPFAPAIAFSAAALYIASPWHSRGLIRCHRRVPLAPEGWRADRDCLHYGFVIGNACVTSCWLLMLACALTGHDAIAMLAGLAIAIAERRSLRPRSRPALDLTFAVAAFYMVQALSR